MKFRRINEDTIRCIVFKEDMQEYGIVLEDFFNNKGKVHDFLHEIVARAEEEIGYEPKNGMLSMQIIPISQNAISITFSEQGSEDYENFMSGMRDSLGELMEDGNLLTGSSEQEDDEVLDGEDLSKQNIEKKVHVTDTDKITTVMIALDSIDTMAEFCRVLNIDKAVKSQLYRLENKGLYFLIIDKGRISADMMRHILLLAVEYTSNITDEAEAIAYIREYGEMIIEKGAYRILKTYV